MEIEPFAPNLKVPQSTTSPEYQNNLIVCNSDDREERAHSSVGKIQASNGNLSTKDRTLKNYGSVS
jgi:hypothetical protein